MDTTNWTVNDHLDWIRQVARNQREMGMTILGWQLDTLGVVAGTVEIVDWPAEGERDPETRLMGADGGFYLVKDK